MHNYLCLEQKMEKKKGSMKSHVRALNNVVPTEAKLCGRTGEEEGEEEEAGSTARGGGGSWGEERSEGSLWAWKQDRRSMAWTKRLSLVPSMAMGCPQQSPSFPTPNHPVSPTILLSKSIESESKAARQAQCSPGPTVDLERIFSQTLCDHHRYLGLGRPLWHKRECFKHSFPSGMPLSQLWPPGFPDYPWKHVESQDLSIFPPGWPHRKRDPG